MSAHPITPAMVLMLLVAPSLASAADLQVEVVGAGSSKGFVNAGLFNQPEQFPKTILKGERAPADPNKTILVFRDLPPGNYAVSAFHDENGNGVLDKNLLGQPTERFGFSRDAKGRLGPPSYDDAKITLGTENQTITITLH